MIAVIMDPLSSINYDKDTSYFLMLAAQDLGHNVYHIDQKDLFLRHNELWSKVSKVKISLEPKPKAEVVEESFIALKEMKLIFVRTDPPFDRRYFYTTLMLEHLPPSTLVANSPQILRDWNEKLAALEFPEYTPDTLMAARWEPILEFANEKSSRLVIKPVDGNGGKGIDFTSTDDPELKNKMAKATSNFERQVVLQRYVPEAPKGDVRVLFLKDKILGAFIRIHAEGQELNNLDQGGTAHSWELTPRQKDICEVVGKKMYDRGVYFTGIDFLGDMLIEINVTSATGLQELTRFSGKPLHHLVISSLID